MGVGLEPSSELRVKKKRKETTIIEVNAIYSPELLTGWGLYKVKEKGKGKRKRPGEKQSQTETDKANPGVCSFILGTHKELGLTAMEVSVS